MLRRLLLASAGAVAVTGSALAADLPSYSPPPAYVPPTPIFTWTGVYIGGQVGYAWGRQSSTIFDPYSTTNFSYTPNGVIGGAHVGYNWQVNQWVFGVEGSVDGTSISKSFLAAPFVTVGSSTDIQGSIRGRLGIAWDRALIYATGGAAFGGFNASIATPIGYDSFSTTRVGWTVGGGLSYAVTNNWSVFAEYRYSDFGNYALFPASLGTNVTLQNHYTQNQVQVGFSYKFEPVMPAPVVTKY
jgi:outer membrane immunogenic protein